MDAIGEKQDIAIGEQPSNPVGEKKKKHHTGLWITLAVIFLVIILPVSLVLAFFYDPSHNERVAAPEDIAQVFMPTVTGLVDNCNPAVHGEEEPSMDLTITKAQLNTVLSYAQNMFPQEVSKYIPSFTCEITKDGYTFDIEVGITKDDPTAKPFGLTHLKLVTKCESNKEMNEGTGFFFTITDVIIGRLGGMLSVAKTLGSSINLGETISSAFKNAGLEHFIVDFENNQMRYTYDGFVADVVKLANLSDSDGIVQSIFSELMNYKYNDGSYFFNYTRTEGEQVSGKGLVTPLKTNSSYCKDSYGRNFSIREKTDKIEGCIKVEQAAGVTGNWSNDELLKIIKFAAFGNNIEANLGDDPSVNNFYSTHEYAQAHRIAAFGSDITMADYSNSLKTTLFNKGSSLKDNLKAQVTSKINDEFATQVALQVAGGATKISFDQISVDETQFNSQFYDCSALGNGAAFYSGNAESYECSFLMTDNVYTTVTDTGMNLIIGFNINGTETSLVVPMNYQASTESGKCTFNQTGTYLWGNNVCTSRLAPLFTLMNNKMSALSIEGLKIENGNMSVDVNSFVTQGLQESPSYPQLGGKNIYTFATENGYVQDVKVSVKGATTPSEKGKICFDIAFVKAA